MDNTKTTNAQELAEVNERIKVVDSEITRLQGLRFGLSLRQAKLEETEMAAHIGRCFFHNGCYARVIAAPAWRGSIPGLTFGEKDFPVLTVSNYSLVPFDLEKFRWSLIIGAGPRSRRRNSCTHLMPLCDG